MRRVVVTGMGIVSPVRAGSAKALSIRADTHPPDDTKGATMGCRRDASATHERSRAAGT
jgi:hypothetical protein